MGWFLVALPLNSSLLIEKKKINRRVTESAQKKRKNILNYRLLPQPSDSPNRSVALFQFQAFAHLPPKKESATFLSTWTGSH